MKVFLFITIIILTYTFCEKQITKAEGEKQVKEILDDLINLKGFEKNVTGILYLIFKNVVKILII
jgi:hypothetical protein